MGHPQEIERTEEEGGKLLVDLVKLAKIAISPALGEGLVAHESHPNQQKYKHSSVRGRVELSMLFRVAKEILMKFAKSIALPILRLGAGLPKLGFRR